MCPAEYLLMVARQLFIRIYSRMAEILHLLGSSSLLALPTEADLNGVLAPEIERIWRQIPLLLKIGSRFSVWPGILAAFLCLLLSASCSLDATSEALRPWR